MKDELKETKTETASPVDALVIPDFFTGQILMCSNVIVDQRMLDIGIYATSRPEIMYEDWTIDGLIQRAKTMNDMQGNCFFREEYFENLKKCRLVDVKIEIRV